MAEHSNWPAAGDGNQPNEAKVRTARSLSLISVVVGAGMLFFALSSGLLRDAPSGFGLLWVVVVLAIVGYHLMNAFGGENRPTLYDIELPESASPTTSPDPTPPTAAAGQPIEQRLEQLDRLREDGVISYDEYEVQRQRILDEL